MCIYFLILSNDFKKTDHAVGISRISDRHGMLNCVYQYKGSKQNGKKSLTLLIKNIHTLYNLAFALTLWSTVCRLMREHELKKSMKHIKMGKILKDLITF